MICFRYGKLVLIALRRRLLSHKHWAGQGALNAIAARLGDRLVCLPRHFQRLRADSDRRPEPW